jgi:hypothetical protein
MCSGSFACLAPDTSLHRLTAAAMCGFVFAEDRTTRETISVILRADPKRRHDPATGHMIFMELPIVAGRMWMRDERGFVVCYDLRKERK